MSIAARDLGLPAPQHQVLVYPVGGTDMNRPSYADSANARPLNKAMMSWFVANATNGGSDLVDPRLDVINARLVGLPPTTIINASIDPLRSDGEVLATKLHDVGVPVERKVYAGSTHEFFGMAAVVDDADQAQAYAVRRLKDSWAAK